jgi:imidazoleglycerol-phosphate dehydratase
MAMKAEVTRKTNETEVTIRLDLDGTGKHRNDTGIGFLDHMLDHLAVHGLLDLEVTARGDLQVDTHHTVEDVAIALGQAFELALGSKAGLNRIGSAYVPMDDTLAFVCLDFSGRPYAVVQTRWSGSAIGPISVSQIDHFLESFAFTSKTTLHARVEYGRDDHHAAEALFKALGRAIAEAAAVDPRRAGTVPSTKGTLV